MTAYYTLQDFGQSERAAGVLEQYERAAGTSEPRLDRMRVLDALYGGLNAEVGVDAAARLTSELASIEVADWRSAEIGHRFALALHSLASGDRESVGDAITELRTASMQRPRAERLGVEAQALILEAALAVREGDASARGLIEEADERFLQGPTGLGVEIYDAMVLATADVYDRLGDPATALRVLERESNFNNFRWPFGARLARERGRLAAVTGDVEQAVRHYEHYLLLRSRADLSFQEEVDEVRAALQELQGD